MSQGALAQPAETTLERGREYTQRFYAGEIEHLSTRLSAEFAEVIGGEAGLRAFFYLPLEHSEELADQERCVQLCQPLGGETLNWARIHLEVIQR